MWFLRRLLGVLLLAECALAASTPRPNVLLITVDTTRADRMGFLGCTRGLTPNLDALAKQGVVFERAYSQYPLTVPSHATILSGTYPQFHRVNDFGIPLGKDVPYLPQILGEQGYKTGAFVASSLLDPTSGWVPGFGRGFDTYDADFHAVPGKDDRYQTLEHRAGYVVAHALAWLKSNSSGPFFAWVHLYDPHIPYDPPEPFKSRYASAPYDGEIAYADSELGKLFAELRARGLYDNTVIAVMSDHGEAFGEHGEINHGIFLYDATIHVPLLFKMPEQHFAGTRVDARAGLVDVVPTILDAVGIAVPKAVQGKSLVPLMKPEGESSPALAELKNRPAYSETDYPHRDYGWSSLRALRADKYLFVKAPRQELYDQSTDPDADHNLATSAPAVTQTLAGRLDSFREKTASSDKPKAADVDPRLVQQLAALGYVGGTHANEPPGAEMTGADPKDKIEVANHVQRALIEIEDGHLPEAIAMLEKIRAQAPGEEIVWRTLGAAYLGQENFEKAVPVLRKDSEMNPDFSLGHYRLGEALFNTNDLEGAKAELQTAIAKSTLVNLKYAATLHFFLAGIYRKMADSADAYKELHLAVELDPENYDANLTLGRLLSMDGSPADGLPFLQKAVKLQPNSFEPHLFLGDALTQLGREMEATAQHQEAERLQGEQQNP
ncbi:MAG: sulfatase-like hydrolase/transferase [Terriglobales bacterium]